MALPGLLICKAREYRLQRCSRRRAPTVDAERQGHGGPLNPLPVLVYLVADPLPALIPQGAEQARACAAFCAFESPHKTLHILDVYPSHIRVDCR